jgi:hypothetical protein
MAIPIEVMINSAKTAQINNFLFIFFSYFIL